VIGFNDLVLDIAHTQYSCRHTPHACQTSTSLHKCFIKTNIRHITLELLLCVLLLCIAGLRSVMPLINEDWLIDCCCFRRCHMEDGWSSNWCWMQSVRPHDLLMTLLLIHLFISLATSVSSYFTGCLDTQMLVILEGHGEGSTLTLSCTR